jgi:very-short-patch-repair endonuclease
MKNLEPNTVLIALMNNREDWATLNLQLWYRIPKKNAPPIIRQNKIKYIAFWHTDVFGEKQRWRVSHYGKVKEIKEVKGDDLFAKGTKNHYIKSEKQYYKVELESLEPLPQPIMSYDGRRILFVPTSEKKFFSATNINSVFNHSPLEDSFQEQLDKHQIPAQREWFVKLDAKHEYSLDFAIFCQKGNINVECDGDTYHLSSDQVHYDKTRNDELVAHGWNVLRYDSTHFEKESDWIEKNLLRTIKQNGGFSSTIDPSVFISPKLNSGQQSLF